MARVTEEVVVDLDRISSSALDRAAERGIQEALAAVLGQLRRENPGSQLSIRVQRRGDQVEGVIVIGSRGASAKPGGTGKLPPLNRLEDWVRAKGLKPVGRGRKRRGEGAVTSVAVALQRSIQQQRRVQRGAASAIRRKLGKGGGVANVRGKKLTQALMILGRKIGEQVRRQGRA